MASRWGKGKYVREQVKPDQIDFARNLALQNERVAIAGASISKGREEMESWFQAINSLESMLSGWWDEIYLKEINMLNKEREAKKEDATIREKVQMGHRVIASLMRLQKRCGFQGERYGEGSTLPTFKDDTTNTDSSIEV